MNDRKSHFRYTWTLAAKAVSAETVTGLLLETLRRVIDNLLLKVGRSFVICRLKQSHPAQEGSLTITTGIWMYCEFEPSSTLNLRTILWYPGVNRSLSMCILS